MPPLPRWRAPCMPHAASQRPLHRECKSSHAMPPPSPPTPTFGCQGGGSGVLTRVFSSCRICAGGRWRWRASKRNRARRRSRARASACWSPRPPSTTAAGEMPAKEEAKGSDEKGGRRGRRDERAAGRESPRASYTKQDLVHCIIAISLPPGPVTLPRRGRLVNLWRALAALGMGGWRGGFSQRGQARTMVRGN